MCLGTVEELRSINMSSVFLDPFIWASEAELSAWGSFKQGSGLHRRGLGTEALELRPSRDSAGQISSDLCPLSRSPANIGFEEPDREPVEQGLADVASPVCPTQLLCCASGHLVLLAPAIWMSAASLLSAVFGIALLFRDESSSAPCSRINELLVSAN